MVFPAGTMKSCETAPTKFHLAALNLRLYSASMPSSVAHLVEEALLLHGDERTELVEAILERSAPSEEFIRQQIAVVSGRMNDVHEGRSRLIPAEEAHRDVRKALDEAK